MLFTQPLFYAFFGVVFVLYWAVPNSPLQKSILLIASFVFYGAWDYRFLALIVISTTIDFCIGAAIARTVNPRRKLGLLIASLATNLGILGFFKYCNFFLDTVNASLHFFGLSALFEPLSIVLPVGISFFTFQSMSYTIDIYRNKLDPIKSFSDFALFVAFFPQLVAGPIVRAAEFFPQMYAPKRFDQVRVRLAVTLFFVGFVKKACIADNIAVPVDTVFNNPGAFDVASTRIAVVGYSIQIYCDFSGYTDMAIGVAALLGYSLPRNFSWPYFSANVQDFWRRWHITLSTYLRDYLYIPLGGGRSRWRLGVMRNLMITMVLGGLWHGASWNFVIWGTLHGVALIVHRFWISKIPILQSSLWNPLKVVFTFLFVCYAWIFFRAETLSDAAAVSDSFLFGLANGRKTLHHAQEYCIVFALLGIVHFVEYRRSLATIIEKLPAWLFSLFLGMGVALALPFVPLEYKPFIYFQF